MTAVFQAGRDPCWGNQLRKTIAAIAGLVLSISACDERRATEYRAEVDIASTVFQHVRVLAVPGEQTLDNQTVIVEGALISVVGPADATSIPVGARLIDGAGLTLMPGLADMHAHYQEEEKGPLFVVNGVTTVRNLWGRLRYFDFDIRAKTGDLVGPHVYTTGPLMDGPNAIFGELAISVDTPEAAVAAVDAQFAIGYSGIKLYEMLDETLYRSAVSAAKARGMKVSSHTPTAMNVETLLELEIDSIEHLDGYGDALSRGQFDRNAFTPRELTTESWNHVDDAAMEGLARQTAAANVWNVATLTVYEQLTQYAAEAEDFFARDEIRYVPPGIIRFWRNRQEYMASRWPKAQKGESARAKFVKALYDAGAPLLVGTDTPNPFLIPGYSIHDELENLSKAGIPNDAILRMATTEAARYLDADGEFGVVAEGARADLILIAGDPLMDLSVLREPVGVMVNGHWRTRGELIEVLESNAMKFVNAHEAEREQGNPDEE